MFGKRREIVQILLTNDDGIHAPGLRAFRDALKTLGEVTTVAPAVEQSGVGLSITYRHPLIVHKHFQNGEEFGWAVAGSPADCVKLGILEFCSARPDIVVSGINAGANTGINVLYSGTVAGAIEGAFFGVTSIAVSLSTSPQPDFARASELAVRLIAQLCEKQPRPGSLWNINLPHTQPRGVKMTSLGVKRHVDVMEKRVDPRGEAYYWSGLDPMENHQMDPGTDTRELADGYATITPMHFDLTESATVESMEGVEWSLGFQ